MLILAFGSASCNNGSDIQSFSTNFPLEYSVAACPGTDCTIRFSVKAPSNSSVKSDRNWCKAYTEWEKNKIHVTLTVADNLSNEDRTALITISSPDVEKPCIVKVVQTASQFKMTGTMNEFAPEGGVYTIRVSSDTPWAIDCEEKWITVEPTAGEATIVGEPVDVKLTVSPNNEGIVRKAHIRLRTTNERENSLFFDALQFEPWETEKRIGDGGLTFDNNRMDSKYPQMKEWITAGRSQGIPVLANQLNNITKTFEPGTTASELNAFLDSSDKNNTRIIYLKNGDYTIDASVRLYSSDVLIGESREGVILHLSGNGNLSFYNGNNIGVRNLTLKGEWSDQAPDPTLMEETLPGKGGHRSIDMTGDNAKECYVDNVKIVNSASHPIWMGGSHHTVRDVEIDGAYNKGGGAQGYFFIDGNHQLVTGCKVTRIRHITMQNPSSKYNVFYKNDVKQEFSFHVNDGGNNLIACNRITLPTTLGSSYCAIMGPWASFHEVGGLNFIYCNRCIEENRGGNTPWSDNKLYIGPWESCPKDVYNNFRITNGYPTPKGSTLYPVVLK